jgi:hypothetical protein
VVVVTFSNAPESGDLYKSQLLAFRTFCEVELINNILIKLMLYQELFVQIKYLDNNFNV